MNKIALVFGTRPETIKIAPIALAIQASGESEVWLWNTGQHRDLVAPMLTAFGLKTNRDLGLMTQGQSPGAFFARAVAGVASAIEAERPDWLVVQGDTTTAAAASLAAFYAKVPVAHVEAGLRTYDLQSPWPEEYNRRVISEGAEWHFAPTNEAKQNLFKENMPEGRVLVTGNTGIDALLWMTKKLRGEDGREFAEKWKNLDPNRPLILCTLHRRESFGETMVGLMSSLKGLVESTNAQIVLPLHPNPEVRKAATAVFGAEPPASLHIINPLEYREFLWLMDHCTFLITDSGGVQEEAPALGKPVIIAREKTERPEAVRAGAAILAGTDPVKIAACAKQLLTDRSAYEKIARPRMIFGDGKASERIHDALLSRHKMEPFSSEY